MPEADYQSLFDKIVIAAKHVPVSHAFSNTAEGKALSAVVHYIEFGDEFLDLALKAEKDATDQLIGSRESRGPDYGIPKLLTRNQENAEVNDIGRVGLLDAPPPQDTREADALRQRIAELEAERDKADTQGDPVEALAKDVENDATATAPPADTPKGDPLGATLGAPKSGE